MAPFIAFLLSIAFNACQKDDTLPIDSYAYYPLELGQYQVYQVAETTYSAGQTAPVVKTWQEKDEVSRIAEQSEFSTTYIVARYTRNSEADYWQKTKEYAITKSPDKILTNLDNQTTFSLVFPVGSGLEWNGNLYNSQDPRKYHYEDIDQPLAIGDLSFDRSLTVVERRDSSLINKYIGIKQYGLGAGLVSDQQINYEYCQDEACIGNYIIESGTHKTRTILSYGNNL
ncbi:hypothetical protein CLV98_101506 [Dyadobacter jejuensis]|uniref:Uncharacterized protein n=1 Tax=Dyadobacter jejuensis TaxID=1082580 RepID=A0A316ARH7_9BACT|nr:hypothetical protein [Dyadobacter jejuensis]PWJ60325.1 hypothetical protein CLV98_101506 [Dyadobacter jejuensis]